MSNRIYKACPVTGKDAWTGVDEDFFRQQWKKKPGRLFKWTFKCSECGGVHEVDSRSLTIAPGHQRFQ